MWLVYMILASDNTIYTGITTNIHRRWKEHETGKGGAKFFRGRKPEYLLYLELGHSRSSATQREIALKKLSRAQKLHHLTACDDVNKVDSVEHSLPVYPLQSHSLR